MAPHTPGTGATVTGVSQGAPEAPASKERYVYGLLARLEQEENLLTKITATERSDSIGITVNLSTRVATVSLVLNCQTIAGPTGQITKSATHYLAGSTFTSGTGGSVTAPNLTQAVMQGIIDLKIIELITARNPGGNTYIRRCQFVVGSSGINNCTFNAELEFPVEVVQLPGGGSIIEGKNWLT